jgi:hypothetical protein
MARKLSRFSALLLGPVLVALGVLPAAAADGTIGVFFDTSGRECAGTVPTAAYTTLHVVMIPEGATSSGITGAEFRVETPPGGAFQFRSEAAAAGVVASLGSALGGGIIVAFATCQTSSAVPLLSFQVFGTGTLANDVAVRVAAKLAPSNPSFSCPLAVQCDAPVFSKVCVEGSGAILNPSGARPCGGARIDSQWSRMKNLYRP